MLDPRLFEFLQEASKTSPIYEVRNSAGMPVIFCRGCKAKNTPFLVDLTLLSDRH